MVDHIESKHLVQRNRDIEKRVSTAVKRRPEPTHHIQRNDHVQKTRRVQETFRIEMIVQVERTLCIGSRPYLARILPIEKKPHVQVTFHIATQR
jgi:hypothetical protein